MILKYLSENGFVDVIKRVLPKILGEGKIRIPSLGVRAKTIEFAWAIDYQMMKQIKIFFM